MTWLIALAAVDAGWLLICWAADRRVNHTAPLAETTDPCAESRALASAARAELHGGTSHG